jgi:hypothetical protein
MMRRLGSLIILAVPLLFTGCTRAGNTASASVARDGGDSTGTATRSGPSIEGTYRLAYRELPDGTRQAPPTVDGLMTFAGGYRNVNIMEHNEGGDIVTLSSVSNYTFTDSLYTEHMHYHIGTGLKEGEGGGFRANLDGSSPVTVGADGSISFDMPLDGPHVVFTADSLTARLGTVLVDHWAKVKSVK